jgi:hypothetical protein
MEILQPFSKAQQCSNIRERERFALYVHARSTAESNPINACLFFFFALRLFLEKKEEVIALETRITI